MAVPRPLLPTAAAGAAAAPSPPRDPTPRRPRHRRRRVTTTAAAVVAAVAAAVVAALGGGIGARPAAAHSFLTVPSPISTDKVCRVGGPPNFSKNWYAWDGGGDGGDIEG